MGEGERERGNEEEKLKEPYETVFIAGDTKLWSNEFFHACASNANASQMENNFRLCSKKFGVKVIKSFSYLLLLSEYGLMYLIKYTYSTYAHKLTLLYLTVYVWICVFGMYAYLHDANGINYKLQFFQTINTHFMHIENVHSNMEIM